MGDIIDKNYKDFFKLFCDFKGFVDFFYLNSFVSEDYSSVKFFIERNRNKNNEADFMEDPLPKSYQEWWELYKNQILFLGKRNELIRIKNNQDKT